MAAPVPREDFIRKACALWRQPVPPAHDPYAPYLGYTVASLQYWCTPTRVPAHAASHPVPRDVAVALLQQGVVPTSNIGRVVQFFIAGQLQAEDIGTISDTTARYWAVWCALCKSSPFNRDIDVQQAVFKADCVSFVKDLPMYALQWFVKNCKDVSAALNPARTLLPKLRDALATRAWRADNFSTEQAFWGLLSSQIPYLSPTQLAACVGFASSMINDDTKGDSDDESESEAQLAERVRQLALQRLGPAPYSVELGLECFASASRALSVAHLADLCEQFQLWTTSFGCCAVLEHHLRFNPAPLSRNQLIRMMHTCTFEFADEFSIQTIANMLSKALELNPSGYHATVPLRDVFLRWMEVHRDQFPLLLGMVRTHWPAVCSLAAASPTLRDYFRGICDAEGRTILHICAQDPALCRVLVTSFGVHPNMRNAAGNTAYHHFLAGKTFGYALHVRPTDFPWFGPVDQLAALNADGETCFSLLQKVQHFRDLQSFGVYGLSNSLRLTPVADGMVDCTNYTCQLIADDAPYNPTQSVVLNIMSKLLRKAARLGDPVWCGEGLMHPGPHVSDLRRLPCILIARPPPPPPPPPPYHHQQQQYRGRQRR